VADNLDFRNVAMIVATIALLGVGQLLFKSAAASIVPGDLRSWLSIPMFAALAVYAVATIAWVVVLSRVPLSAAFPFYGLSFLIVPLLSTLFLGERLRWSTLVGGAIILVGVIVSSRAR
jgi:undecaprenyl phosphate-alpha-L-ara4N flippase subunit ArnE